jgi:hypothetical protein
MSAPVQEETFLTLVRQPDGRLAPYVDGKRLIGAIDTTVNTNGNQQLAQIVFHASLVVFKTARNPQAEQMN